MPIFAEHWGEEIICNFALFSTMWYEPRPRFFFQKSKSSEDQKRKKRSSPKMEEFVSPNSSEDQKLLRTSSSAQMQTRVKMNGSYCLSSFCSVLAQN